MSRHRAPRRPPPDYGAVLGILGAAFTACAFLTWWAPIAYLALLLAIAAVVADHRSAGP